MHYWRPFNLPQIAKPVEPIGRHRLIMMGRGVEPAGPMVAAVAGFAMTGMVMHLAAGSQKHIGKNCKHG